MTHGENDDNLVLSRLLASVTSLTSADSIYFVLEVNMIVLKGSCLCKFHMSFDGFI